MSGVLLANVNHTRKPTLWGCQQRHLNIINKFKNRIQKIVRLDKFKDARLYVSTSTQVSKIIFDVGIDGIILILHDSSELSRKKKFKFCVSPSTMFPTPWAIKTSHSSLVGLGNLDCFFGRFSHLFLDGFQTKLDCF